MKLPILVSVSLFLAACSSIGQADESPGFFLKITKNVPRLGKRDESFVMKNMRTIPRIGRSEQDMNKDGIDLREHLTGSIPQTSVTPLLAWLWDLPQPIKRRLPINGGPSITERELAVVQPVNSNTLIELLDRDAIPSEHIKFVHWKDFDRALLADAELYNKVIQLGRKPDRNLKQDLSFNNYIPIFGNNNAGGNDFMMYNKDDSDLYGSRFDRNYLQYNHLK
ncbi:uncharacterized protein LOC115633906 [Scaptodrosophila lebanonensis]|uniref:Uncharacterized protein LOC115633906 n=1 Tax=Drosophila lebanonensis TaxID=7225 RepID=A0A6J2UGP9_DROLE|nr:uncharacterized protein LOC115633906 [Scaptodrosophila lebanonensis]